MAIVKKTVIDMGEERRILTHMIVSTPFLDAMIGVAEARLFESSYLRLVATWVFEFYAIAKVAPEKAIQDIYRSKVKEISEDDQELITDLLTSLSRDYTKAEPTNIPFATEQAIKFFKLQACKKLRERLDNAITEGNPVNAEKAIGDFRRVEKVQGKGINLFSPGSGKQIVNAYDDKEEILFRLQGAFGEIVGPICRGDFVAVLAPMKRGKSWALMHLAQRAYLAGLNVAYLSFEMMENQIVRRIWNMVEGHPSQDSKVRIPYFVDFGDKPEDGSRIEFRTEMRKGMDLDTESIEKRIKSYSNQCDGSLRLFSFPTDTFTPKDLRKELANLRSFENWVPDVIVADYADIMRADIRDDQRRERINSIWLSLRGLAQEMHIAVATASQSGRQTVDGKEVQSGDIAEDIRKIAHVTKLITLNQNEKEAEFGIMRVSQKVQREGKTIWRQAVILQCLDIGRFYLDSRFCDNVDGLDEYRGKND